MPDADTTDIEVFTETPEEPDTSTATDETADSFPREYVEKIRRESQGYRERARAAEGRAEELARALFTAKVAATGKLADPDDLDYSDDLLNDSDALAAAIDALIERKPHLKARSISGDAGMGQRGHNAQPPSLMQMLRSKV